MIMINLHQKGMTLIEMLVVIGLWVLLIGMVFGFAQSFYQTNSYLTAQAGEVDNARRGVTKLTRDLREMTYAENGTFPVAEIEEHLIGFYSDVDKDDLVEYIEYELSGTTLYRRSHDPTGSPPVYDYNNPDTEEIVSEYVQNISQGTSTFFYYDSVGTELDATALLTDVRYIRAQIIVNIDPVRSPGEFMLRTAVAPRNIKDNL
ncbi:prepilin-type N-terminal cleavage/methylation domain-containing protein [Candidatus Kaiserbacteria bacterium]|nr:prepilin-type N-terminal cleavage/methylation domain-containing protein [Candidatus Kaiserbacteria bacterium]MCB9812320.1 prepilin-type N-terminal cleavage/methylation domain-containing protein [Candidatus Nomurabacteria bacterium]